MKNIKRRLTPQPLKIRADVDMTCYAYDGVLHIQVSIVLATAYLLVILSGEAAAHQLLKVAWQSAAACCQ